MYYQKIVKELERIELKSDVEKSVQQSCFNLFWACQEYCRLNKILKFIGKTKTKEISFCFIPKKNWLTSKENSKEEECNNNLMLWDKDSWQRYVYYTYFQKLYTLLYCNEKWDHAMHDVGEKKSVKESKDAIRKLFSQIVLEDKDIIEFAQMSRDVCKSEQVNDIDKDINKESKKICDYLEIIGKALQTEAPCEQLSVEEVIDPEILSYILLLLESKKYVDCLFVIAPALRALTIGRINSFTPTINNLDNKNAVYFKERYEYNLTKLKDYEENLKNIYYGDDIVEGYVDIVNRLNKVIEEYCED